MVCGIAVMMFFILIFSRDLSVSLPVVRAESFGYEEALLPPQEVDGQSFQNITFYSSPEVKSDCKDSLATLLGESLHSLLLPERLDIELYSASPTSFHGLSVGDTIKLNCNLSAQRFREVFYHELGHVVFESLDAKKKAVFEKKHAVYDKNGQPNYLTQYATGSAQEDFADSFMIYMTRRNVFEQRAKGSPVLRAKFESIDSNM